MGLVRVREWKLGRTFMAVAASVALIWASIASGVHAAPAHSSTTLTMWSGISGADQDAFKSIVDGFNASQSDVTINYVQQDFTHYGTKLTVALSGGTGPDIWTMDNAGMITYAAQGVVEPLDDILKGSSVVTSKNFGTQYWNAGKYKGHLYAVPLDVEPLVMFYNKKLFSKAHLKAPPFTSFKAFLAAAKKLTHKDTYGTIVPPDWPVQYWFPTFLAQFGGKLLDTKNGKAVFNSAAGVKALTLMRDLIFKYHVSPPNTAIDQDIKFLANNSAAMILDGPWMLKHPTVQTLGNNLGVAPVPQFGPKKGVFVGSLYFMANAKNSSDNNKAILKWLEYFQQHSIKMAAAGPVPAYKPVLSSPEFKKLSASQVVAGELKFGTLPAGYPKYDDHWLWQDAVFPALRGSQTNIKALLDSAATKVTNHMHGG